jgi:hypothetical protein
LQENIPESYSTPFLGYRFYKEQGNIDPWYGYNLPMHGMYRWHIMDSIHFEKDLKVTIQQLGYNGAYYDRSDDVSSVAYWYQCEPHQKYKNLLPKEERRPR